MAFTFYPGSNRVPGSFHEILTTRSNTATANLKTFLIGQKFAAGSATANVPVNLAGLNPDDLFGAGSMLARMASTYRQHDSFGEVWALPLTDDGAAVAATGTVTATGTALSAGTLALYAGGDRYPFNVAAGDTAVVALTSLIKSVCGKPRTFDILVGAKVLTLTDATNPGLATDATTATIASPLTIRARNAGAAGNAMGLILNHRGPAGGETQASGLTITATPPTNGATNPSLTTALASMSDLAADIIVCPYTDTTSLDALKVFLNDTTGRWSWSRAIFGHVFAAFSGTVAASVTFAKARNDQHLSVLPYNGSPDPVWEWAAAFAGAAASSLRADPSQPVTLWPMYDEAPAFSNRAGISERNTLLYGGCSSWYAGDDSQPTLERVTTSYTTTAGVDDNSWLDIETPFTLSYIIRDMRSKLTTTFARKKIVSDTTIITAAMSNVVTTRTIKAFIIQLYRTYQDVLGLVQNADKFADTVQVINMGNGTVQVIWPGDLAQQLRQIVVTVAFAKP